MKIICTQENLTRGLQIVSHVASKNVSLPILNNVLIKAEAGVIILMTTNLEIGITCQVRGKIMEEGSFTVQAKTLSDYINLLPKENITLELSDQNLKIECQKSKTIMKGVESSEFPLIPEVEAINAHEVKAVTLKEALISVSIAVANDETRPEISGVYFSFQGDFLTLVATDSYRLAEKKVKLDKGGGDKNIIVPLKTVQELIRILSGGENQIVVISGNENQILFSLNEANLTSRLIEGQYPDYQQIIPNDFRTNAVLDTAELINTVKRASLFCKPGGNDIALKLYPGNSEVVVSAANMQVGESEARQEAAVEGDENGIIFNSRFLLDGLQNIDTEECIFEMSTNMNPGLIKPKKDSGYIYIIMPIKQ